MGTRNGPYVADFPVDTTVRVAPRDDLDAFVAKWKWHHPLQAEQLEFAGWLAIVKSVAFYHGGDELYELHEVPGIWHEACLRRPTRVVVDVSDIETPDGLHALLADRLGFPDYYGKNWDAFEECFGDEGGVPLPDAVRFVGMQALETKLPREAQLLRACLQEHPAVGSRCRVEWAG
jgi:RNAse (barnase) inhibitor barstar